MDVITEEREVSLQNNYDYVFAIIKRTCIVIMIIIGCIYRPISHVVIGREFDYRSRLIYVRY